jgi:hypothetical protein
VSFWLASVLLGLATTHCQHARVVLPDRRAPVLAAAQAATAGSAPGRASSESRVLIGHSYYLFGLFPRSVALEEREVCPGARIGSIHQYSSWSDGLLEQLSLGIYSPRTVEIVCVVS